MEKSAYVYWYRLKEHTSKDLLKEGYVGVTVDLKTRHASHTRHSKQSKSVLRLAFQKYGEQQIIRTLLYKGSIQQAYAIEKKLRPIPEIGWNLAIGGGKPPDCTGRNHTQETKQKMSKNNSKYWLGKTSLFKGKTNRWSEEMKKQIGQHHIGVTVSEKHRQAIRDKLSGGKSPMAKQIHLIHKKDLTKVYTFNSISEAATALSLNYSRIRSLYQTMCRTKRAAGFTWFCLSEHQLTDPKLAVEEAQKYKCNVCASIAKACGKDNHASQPIVLEHTSGLIQSFESINQAAKHVNMSEATLRYHVIQTKKYHKDANYTREGWKVNYKKVQE